MSLLFPPNSFDAIFSSSVFEHLLMPWIVAAEMSRVLRPGGIAFIATHQTIGMHDRPWDFWRFSDTAWDALFNKLTGFEILDRALENPQFITPFFWSPEQGDGPENALGFIGSSVLVRKIGEPQVNWGPMAVSDVIPTSYPMA
jgi:SAM-dependent methyltransferase